MTLASLIVAVSTAAFAAQTGSGRSAPPKSGTLDIYWIDVEGGASTLIVTPAGESVLMDAGFAGFNDRDAARVEHVVRREAVSCSAVLNNQVVYQPAFAGVAGHETM